MRLKSSNKINASFSMSSMTDIVFLLLIFFILSTNNIKGLNLVLPKAKGKSSSVKSVSVSVNAKEEYFVNEQKATPTDKALEKLILEKTKVLEKPIIILHSEENTPIQYVVKVMDIANKNNIEVILAVRSQ